MSSPDLSAQSGARSLDVIYLDADRALLGRKLQRIHIAIAILAVVASLLAWAFYRPEKGLPVAPWAPSLPQVIWMIAVACVGLGFVLWGTFRFVLARKAIGIGQETLFGPPIDNALLFVLSGMLGVRYEEIVKVSIRLRADLPVSAVVSSGFDTILLPEFIPGIHLALRAIFERTDETVQWHIRAGRSEREVARSQIQALIERAEAERAAKAAGRAKLVTYEERP
jgi:hypothetical protein